MPASSSIHGLAHRPLVVFLALAWLQLSPLSAPANACSCVVDVDAHPCGSLLATDVVFVGQPVEARETSQTVVTSDGHSYERPIRKFRFDVREKLVGRPGATVVVETGGGGGDCGYSFTIGQEYLVYATEVGGRLVTSICSSTRLARDADEELAYARRLAAGESPTLIYGTTRWFRGRSGSFRLEPIEEAKIEAEDREGKIYRTTTDSAGEYRLEVPAGGRFQLSARWSEEIPEAEDVVVSLETGHCAPAHWTVDLLPRVEGFLIEADGQLASYGIEVSVEPTDGRQAPADVSAYSNDDGSFELTLPVSGEFLLVARSPHDHKYPTVYYPGTEDPERAVPLTLVAGDRIDVGAFTLAPPREKIELSGTVLRPDGSAASHVRFFVYIGERLEQPIQTNERGEFSLDGYSGITYSFRPYTSRYPARRLVPTEMRPEKGPDSQIVEIELRVEG